eukprot:6357486-Pyramimonas_sp.AAC.1
MCIRDRSGSAARGPPSVTSVDRQALQPRANIQIVLAIEPVTNDVLRVARRLGSRLRARFHG